MESNQPLAYTTNPGLDTATAARVEGLLSRMSLEEKIGQMTQVEKNSLAPSDVAAYYIGSVLSGGGGYPPENTASAWAEMVDEFQKAALQTRLGIPILYGVDAVHGHGNLRGATIFPHNIGLGATRDADLVQRIGRATAIEIRATGIHWNFAPTVAVPQDIRWGRTYEGYSQDTDLVTSLAVAYTKGLQGDDLKGPLSVLSDPKHFIGDGATTWGTSRYSDFQIDQGDTRVDEETLRAMYLPPYEATLQAGAQIVMASFSSWNGLKLHAHKYLLTEVLKGELDFKGFVVSDWSGIDQISPNYYQSVVAAINAGIDMSMVPVDYLRFIANLGEAVQNGDVSQERIDDAVRRILTVKVNYGLFERPFADPRLLPEVGSAEHRALAREAVAKSLVLLKNEGQTLPLSKSLPLIRVAGQGAHDIGLQCGGWTIEWLGKSGNITPGVTILEALRAAVSPGTQVDYEAGANFPAVPAGGGSLFLAEAGIVVVSETPYAEGYGDRANLQLSAGDIELIERMRQQSKKLVVILLSGRPMVVTNQLPLMDAFVAAWLPGSEGQGVADVLFGDLPFTGKLPYTWPRSMDQIPFDLNAPEAPKPGPLFPFGYGLTG